MGSSRIPLWRNPSTTYSLISTHAESASKHAAQLKEPFVMAAIANAASHEKWAQGRLRQDSCREIIGEFALVHRAVHLCSFVGSDGVHFFAQQCDDSESAGHRGLLENGSE